MSYRVPPPPPPPEPPAVPMAGSWPTWAHVVLGIVFWPLLVLVTLIAFRVSLHVGCMPANAPECDLMRPPRAVMTITGTLGLVAFFIAHVRFAGRARAVYLGAWLLLLLAWMIAMAYLPRTPLGIQAIAPAAFAFLLARGRRAHP